MTTKVAKESMNPTTELSLMINETVADLQDLQGNLSAYGGSDLTNRQKDVGKLVINGRIFASIDEMKDYAILRNAEDEITSSYEYIKHLIELRRYLN
jgi:hypothetical protein